jgi:hypothetical protein
VGVKWGLKSGERDVYLNQFLYAWLGVMRGLKEKINFNKNPLKSVI